MKFILYKPENIQRMRYAYAAAATLCALITAWSLFTTMYQYRSLLNAKSRLRITNASLVQLAQQLKAARDREGSLIPAREGGIDQFATHMAAYAKTRGVRISRLVPQGNPVSVEPIPGNEYLGSWQAENVTLEGEGPLDGVIGFFNDITRPNLPVRLESFLVKTDDGGQTGRVAFALELTIHRKEVSKGS